jgi:hypothetical protein
MSRRRKPITASASATLPSVRAAAQAYVLPPTRRRVELQPFAAVDKAIAELQLLGSTELAAELPSVRAHLWQKLIADANRTHRSQRKIPDWIVAAVAEGKMTEAEALSVSKTPRSTFRRRVKQYRKK